MSVNEFSKVTELINKGKAGVAWIIKIKTL